MNHHGVCYALAIISFIPELTRMIKQSFAAVLTLVLIPASTAFAKGSHGGGHSSSHSSKSTSGSESRSTEHVGTYTRKNGTVVQAHDKTTPDHDKTNNWSTKGNVNPETGKPGTVDPNKP